jgi:hypothetical protein
MFNRQQFPAGQAMNSTTKQYFFVLSKSNMTVRANFNSLSLILAILVSCETTRVYRPTVGELNSKNYVRVSLQELYEYKGKYHGQIVETAGFFRFGFEESAIYLGNEFGINSLLVSLKDSTRLFGDACGIWIDFNLNHPFHQHYPPDSLKRQLVVVKGLFDTTRLGHVGGCYRATLTDTYSIRIVGKAN